MTRFTSLKRRFGIRVASLALALGVLFPVGAAMAIPTTLVGAMKTQCIVLDDFDWYLATGTHSEYGGTLCWRS